MIMRKQLKQNTVLGNIERDRYKNKYPYYY